MYLFYIFILAIILLGSVQVGPLSLRVYATCLMGAYLILNAIKKNGYIGIKRITKSYIILYIIFIIFMGIALLANGEFIEYGFIKKFLAYYLVCIIAYFSIEKFINTRKQLHSFIFFLSTIILFNNLITIFQFMDIPLAWLIGDVLGDISFSVEYLDNHDDIIGASITPGIFGGAVRNAFYIASVTPLFYGMIRNESSIIKKIFYIIVILLSIVACYITQQRTAFALIILALLVYLFFSMDIKYALGIISLGIIIALYYNLNEIDMGRLTQFSNDDRRTLINDAINYIRVNPIFGGPVEFQKNAGLSSHNIILDSWIFSGFFGFLIMMVLYIKTVIDSIRSFFYGYKYASMGILFSALAVLNAMLYGLLHNTSYLTGSELVFIVLAIMLKTNEIALIRIKR